MSLRRQHSPLAAIPSIDPRAGFGVSTAQRDDDDSLDMGGSPMDVIAVSRGRRIDAGTLTQEDTDLVGTGQRVDVEARSGNEAGQHEEDDIPDDGAFDQVGMGDAVAPTGMTTVEKTLLGAGIMLLLWKLAKG
jgi:hypothetical protein